MKSVAGFLFDLLLMALVLVMIPIGIVLMLMFTIVEVLVRTDDAVRTRWRKRP